MMTMKKIIAVVPMLSGQTGTGVSTQLQKLRHPDATEKYFFSQNVEFTENLPVAGATGDDTGQQRAYICTRHREKLACLSNRY